MKLRSLFVVLISLLLIMLLFTNCSFVTEGSTAGYANDVWVGVDIAYYNFTEFKAEVDEISAYTNLIVIGTTGITYNETLLDEACNYLRNKDLSFIIYIQTSIRANQAQWFQNATAKWGNYFLGIYSGADEYGGKQLDLFRLRAVWQAENYSDAADQYVSNLTRTLTRTTQYCDASFTVPMFISEYALYWFDYKAGCNTVFAEFGWNYSRQLNVALCRGAATIQNKDWGVMIAWKYNEPPYVESSQELYQDLISAYDSGAKYILIFDSDKNYTHSILKAEHLETLKQFWQYAQNNPRKSNPISERVACILPRDYGYGFRGPSDKIWGLWEADDLAYNISQSVNGFLEKYGDKLDIVYDDELLSGKTYGYSKVLPWDSYNPEPPLSPSSTPSASPASSPTPDPTLSPTSTTSPTPSELPNPTPPLEDQTFSTAPSQQPSPSPEVSQAASFPTLTVSITIVFAVFVILVIGKVFFTRKQPEAIAKPMKLTFQGMWHRENQTRINTMGQGELQLDNSWRSRCNGTLDTDSGKSYGKIEGTLTFEGENGDRLFVHLTGTQQIDGLYTYSELNIAYRIWLRTSPSGQRGSIAYSELSGSYRVTGGTGRFQGATGNGVFSARLTIDPSQQHGYLSDGLMTGGILPRE